MSELLKIILFYFRNFFSVGNAIAYGANVKFKIEMNQILIRQIEMMSFHKIKTSLTSLKTVSL